MKKRTSIEEMNAICTMLISDFLKKFHYSNTRVIDIEDFVTRYLGTTILYEDFAVDVPGRGGFISDGEQALPVLRNGMRQFVIFPENVIVIDSSLNSMDNLAKYRFTVAHEAAHFIMCKHVGGDFTAAFHTEYVDGEYYTTEMLKEMIQPFILRRTKQQVLKDLPEKTEDVHYIEMTDEELTVYEKMRQTVELKFKKNKTKAERDEAKGIDISYFEELMKLRLASCDMHLVYSAWRDPSTKIISLMDILETLLDIPENNVLVFSQFTSFLARIKPEIERHGWDYLYLDGQTPMKKRQEIVEQFQTGEKRLFLSSLKAGGLGINLTAANYVILLDPWWNPAIENQATDRTHRIGQKRCVSVIRLITEHTIEEKILRLHEKKQQLSDDVLEGTSDSYKLTYEDILDMVSPY